MATYRRGPVFWWKSRLRFGFVPNCHTMVRLSLCTASPQQARSRAAELDLAKDAMIEQMPILRRNVKAEDMPALHERAFERELDRVIMAQFHEPGRVEDHLAFNCHYARYFTLLATEPRLLDGSLESYEELRERGLSEEDADALTALASRRWVDRLKPPGAGVGATGALACKNFLGPQCGSSHLYHASHRP